jgi:hypothetical protein
VENIPSLICSGSHLIYVDYVVAHILYVEAHTLYVDYVVAHGVICRCSH